MISFGKVEYRQYSKRRISDKVDKGEWWNKLQTRTSGYLCRSDRVWAPLGSESAVWAAKASKKPRAWPFSPCSPKRDGWNSANGNSNHGAYESSPFDSSYQVVETTRCAVGRSWSLRCCFDMLLGDVPAVSKERKMRISGRP